MRLIDADALEKEIKEKDIMGGLNYRWYIQNAPTVDVLEQIRDEISAILTNSYDEGVKEKALQIIDKYR